MSDTDTVLPTYRVVAPCFIEPYYFGMGAVLNPSGQMVGVGSEIEYEGPPGPHLEPTNAAARAAMEEWYDTTVDPTLQPYPTKDARGEFLDTRPSTPRAKYRHAEIEPGTRNPVRVIGSVPKNEPGVNPLSLAEVAARAMPDTDQRPGPRITKRALQSNTSPPVK